MENMELSSARTFYGLLSILLMLTCPQKVSLSVDEPDPGGTTLSQPDVLTNQNVTGQTDSATSIPSQVTNATAPPSTTEDLSYLEKCPVNARCEDLSAFCIDCAMNHYCRYGTQSTANCTVKEDIKCMGEQTFLRSYHCSYCYQLPPKLYTCTRSTDCNMKKAPRQRYYASCTVKEDVVCLGSRTFQKSVTCNWTSGYKWSTALVLSVTLGGFGVDRFYLGLWREGIGKLFSFGGLGVWTLVDVILIAVGYVGPYDGSLYIYPWD